MKKIKKLTQDQRKDLLKSVELKHVIGRINSSLSKVNVPGVKLVRATVTLQTTYGLSAQVGFELFVTASRKWASESSNSVTYTFIRSGRSLNTEDSISKLVDAIQDAAKQYKESSSVSGLEKDSLEIEISFSFTGTTTVGLALKIFDGSFEFGKTVFHKIALTFK